MKRHLSEQQLVDFVIGKGSRFGKLAARHHLARCAHCRQDLDNLRHVDRQLVSEGGQQRLAAIPRVGRPDTARTTRIDSGRPAQTSARPGIYPRWQLVGVPLMAAACALFVLQAAVQIPETPSLPSRDSGQAERKAEPLEPMLSDPQANSFPEQAEVVPVVAKILPPTVTTERRDDDLDIRPGLSTTPRPRVRKRPMQHHLDTASQVICQRQRHPGAGRGDDRISPPIDGV